MLVLGRREGQKILIGDDITLKIIRISKNFVRLGFEAPKEIKIFREEIKDNKKEERDV